jgi:succinyl-diaminopimelate desuccinylase
VEVGGVAAHASRPFLGENAIDRMAALYERLRAEFPNPSRESDWKPSLSMTTVNAGEASNQIPDSCHAGFDLRITENETADEVRRLIKRIVADFRAEVIFHQISPATYYPREAPVARH